MRQPFPCEPETAAAEDFVPRIAGYCLSFDFPLPPFNPLAPPFFFPISQRSIGFIRTVSRVTARPGDAANDRVR